MEFATRTRDVLIPPDITPAHRMTTTPTNIGTVDASCTVTAATKDLVASLEAADAIMNDIATPAGPGAGDGAGAGDEVEQEYELHKRLQFYQN